MFDEKVEEISDKDLNEHQCKSIILGISIFMFIVVLFFGTMILSSCTYSVRNVMTSGEASGIADSDDDQTVDPTTTIDPKPLLGL